MARESKRKQLHYRKAVFSQPSAKSLQDLLEEALSKLPKVVQRFQPRDDGTDDGWQSFINHHKGALGMQLGNLVLHAVDQSRHIIAIDETAEQLNIEHIAPPSLNDGKKRQFLESILYYGVMGNHVIILQSMSLKARDLENYLSWILRAAGVMAEDNAVLLDNYVSAVTQQQLENTAVKSVKIGTPLFENAALADAFNSNGANGRLLPRGEGAGILKALAPERWLSLGLSDASEASDLQVRVEVTYNRQASLSSQRTLNKIAQALRHVSDEDIRIELKNGGTVVGSELQVKTYVPVDTFNGVMDAYDVWNKMQGWLIDILDQGLIDAE